MMQDVLSIFRITKNGAGLVRQFPCKTRKDAGFHCDLDKKNLRCFHYSADFYHFAF